MEVNMTDKPGFFRKAVEQLIEGRHRSAQRYVDSYLREHGLTQPKKD